MKILPELKLLINMSFLAPIALFVYNRLDHTVRTIEALQKNQFSSESELYIFSDAAKTEGHQQKVNEVRNYIKTIKGFKNVHIHERNENLGLSRSIILGVTDLVEKYGRIIVLEDDMVTSPGFLNYMNQSLDLYKDELDLICIHGYVYPSKVKLPETFFLPGADCWGWATWKRGWELFEKDGSYLLKEIQSRNLERDFNFNNTYHYSQILKEDIEGKVDSWAIRWYASAFLKGKFTLYPGRSLVNNIGLDGSGVHCEPNKFYNHNDLAHFITVSKNKVVKSQVAYEVFQQFFRESRIEKKRRPLWKKIIFWKNN